MTPRQPIPETTQSHVDRVVGTTVGGHRVVRHVAEARFGTIYRCEGLSGGQPATLEVMRTQLVENEREARAANAIKCPGIATVTAFGELPDGRRWRLMESIDGDPLERVLDTRKRLPPLEVVKRLGQVATVLEAAHAWAVAHGNLLASNVFVVGDEVKLIDFGLARQPPTAQADLQALGRLGFTLLSGEDRSEGPLPPLASELLAPVDRLLRALVDGRVKNATAARKALSDLALQLSAAGRPAGRRWVVGLLAAVAVAALAGGGLVLAARDEPGDEARLTEEEEIALLEGAAAEPLEAPEPLAPVEPAPTSPPAEKPAPPIARPPRSPRKPRPPPDAEALLAMMAKSERQLRAQARAGDELDQALSVLNKQRARLAGSPTVEDRRDVSRQLAGWRRSYLHKR
ncbi:MAG: protein kinase [Myxococcaceae bacterium]|nr:protein kinase [Myxococcaceae bacterium]